ncbi:MAG: AraC family transcriptional regulator [Acidobacteriota bacterium]|nr:AraC family transcriptional regulator [Acidobacteriota bacterium]MDH3784228.1 AraC family transcriptional regulator [Acidobacteriota bacterium]
MPRPRQDSTTLLRRIGYDAALEERGLGALALGDRSAARELLLRLSGTLQPGEGPREGRVATQLLLGLLHQVHGSLAETDVRSHRFQTRRLELIQQFDGCRSFAIARQRFDEILGRLLRAQTEPAASDIPEIVERALTYIDRHFRRRISLSDVAAGLHVSSNYLSRNFKKHAGHTITEAIQRRRLDSARRLLSNGERSLSEIAYRVGYQNYRDFYRNFVKYERASPRQVQRKLHSQVS